MSKSSKNYVINADVFNGLSAEVAKLPKQQQIILRAMVANCTETEMKGSDIIACAVKDFGLETRQKYTVLYAWYARSNENFGVSVQKTTSVEGPREPDVAHMLDEVHQPETKSKKSGKHA